MSTPEPSGSDRFSSPASVPMSGAMDPQGVPTERRSPDRFFYTKDQLLRRSPIYVRRRRDKQRLAGHLGIAAALVLLSMWWVIPLHSFAGPVMLTFAPGHGVHIGDLPTLAFLALAVRSVLVAARIGRTRLARLG